MSLASVMGRIQELEALVRPPAPAPAPPAAAGAGSPFAAQLAAASTPAGTPAAPAGAAPAGGPTAYDGLIADAAARHGVDPALLKGLIRQESNFDPNAGSPAGARGLCQLMPGTAAGLGVGDPTDPAQAVEGGAKYLRQQLDAFGGSVPLALAAYNAGPGAVRRHGGVPPYAETQHYVRQVQAFADAYRGAAPVQAGAAAAPVQAAAAAAPVQAAAAAAPVSNSLPYRTV